MTIVINHFNILQLNIHEYEFHNQESHQSHPTDVNIQ